MPSSYWIRVGAILGFLAVAAGAFGAHLLEKQLEPKQLQVFETAVRYQMFHALALLSVGILVAIGGTGRAIQMAGWGFLLGTVVFSGSLYALALTGVSKLGMITPIGGVGYLWGWVALIVHSLGLRTVAQRDRGV